MTRQTVTGQTSSTSSVPPPAFEGAPEVEPKSYHCWPHRPSVDRTSRRVTCGRCKVQLDPIEVLLEVANDRDRWVSLQKEVSTMRRELEALKAEEKRVKERTKAASRKDAAEAVAAERERQTRARFEVLTRTDDIRRSLERIEQLMGKPKRRP